MGAIDHHPSLDFRFLKLLLCYLDTPCIVVHAGLATTEDDEAVLVSCCANNCYDSRLGNGQEVVGALGAISRYRQYTLPISRRKGRKIHSRSNRINCNVQASICAILEPNRETQPTGQFSVQLALCGPRADSSNAQQVGKKLR